MLERIANCRIVEEVASGGMAVVYRAIQEPLDRTVAIKALKTSAAIEESIVTRFEREAKSLANLQHENIIHVYDLVAERGSMFIVMEFVEGTDLYDLLDKCGRLPYDVAAVIAMQVARALDYIHYRSIVHRDIKPANIMLSKQGGVKLMDFGIARDRSFGDLTEAGTGIGTPAYMSPEQIIGDKPDARSDIFSLGIVLYQMATGRKPFIEDEQKSVMHKIRLDRHVKVRKLNPDIPRELERIIDKCLEKQPRDRWRSGQQLVMALERFLSKHVDMNYHARLVLFLRSQGVITQLEADEYISPSIGAAVASALAAPNLATRQIVRRGALVQGVILGVAALMVGLIHLAPIGAAVPTLPAVMMAPDRGYLRVVVRPWGRISADGKELGVTPMAAPIELEEGSHEIRIEHDSYQPLVKTVEIPAGPSDDPVELKIDLEKTGTMLPGVVRPKPEDPLEDEETAAPAAPAAGAGVTP
jgi:eukaryotic-like serine/threonine-protein kinase